MCTQTHNGKPWGENSICQLFKNESYTNVCIMKTRHRIHAHFSSNSVALNQCEPIIASNIYLVHIKDSPTFHSKLQAVANGSLLHVQQSQVTILQ